MLRAGLTGIPHGAGKELGQGIGFKDLNFLLNLNDCCLRAVNRPFLHRDN